MMAHILFIGQLVIILKIPLYFEKKIMEFHVGILIFIYHLTSLVPICDYNAPVVYGMQTLGAVRLFLGRIIIIKIYRGIAVFVKSR